MACARNYFEMRAEMVTNYYTLTLSPQSFLKSLSLFVSLSPLSALSFILSCRKQDLNKDSGASIHYFQKHRKSVNITSLWVKIGIRQTVALAAACYTLKNNVRCQVIQLPGKLGFQETITFVFFVIII